MSQIDLSIVVPVFNNASTLDELIDRLVAVLEPLPFSFEMIFVDDGSSDGSLELLRRRAGRDPRIRPFALARNFGSQAAACAGFDLARGERVVCLDADLDNRPEDVPALLAPLERGYDLVCGYREDAATRRWSRRLPSALMNAYVRRRTGHSIRDVGCGMRAFRAHVVRDLAAEGERRRLLTPLFLQRARRMIEVPIRQGAGREAGGHSFLTLLAIAADYYLLTARRPFLITGLASAAAVGAGALLLLFGPRLWGLVIAAAGLLGLPLSLLGEYTQRLYALSQNPPYYQLRDDDEERSAAGEAE